LNVKVIGYYDLRPVDWLSGKRMPLTEGECHICDRCGAEHAVVWEVKDLDTGKVYSVGSGCAKQTFGFEPDKTNEAKELLKNHRQQVAMEINEARLEAIRQLADSTAKEIATMARPKITVSESLFKYPHFSGQLVRTFTMGDVSTSEPQPAPPGNWNDRNTLWLLENRWISARSDETIPPEWKSLSVAPDSNKLKKGVRDMTEVYKQMVWRLSNSTQR
jgi:hypothetical protein